MIFWPNLRFCTFIFNDLINAFDFPINFSEIDQYRGISNAVDAEIRINVMRRPNSAYFNKLFKLAGRVDTSVDTA